MKIYPIFYASSLKVFFTLSEETWDLISLESLDSDVPIISYDCSCLQPFDVIYDAKFLEFLITKSLEKEEEFKEEIATCKQLSILQETCSNDFSKIKEYLLLLVKLTYSHRFITLAKKYFEYYNKIIRAFIYNIIHYNKQKLYFDSDKLLEHEELLNVLDLKFEGNGVYIPVHINHYDWSLTGRINAALYSKLSSLKPLLVPKNDYILEIDCRAAEWNFLLFLCSENNNFNLSKRNYWEELREVLGCSDVLLDVFKRLLYSYIFGEGKQESLKKGISEEQYDKFIEVFQRLFPKTFDFCHVKNDTIWMSKDSNVIYDYFGKEKFVDKAYKKLNYFLQSSLASHFQYFVSHIIKEMTVRHLESTVLLTIHDSMFLDIKASERQEVFSIIKEYNKEPELMLMVKDKIENNVTTTELQET